MRFRISRRWMMSVALVAAAANSGCAEERAPINQVQPDALQKSFFLGEKLNDFGDDPMFYWRNFVVDGSEAQSMVGIGSWGAVERIRWDVQEDMLYARRAYQSSDGADNKGMEAGPPNGAVVAAYRITSHFDIRRSYNPQTGEDTNVVVENGSDRPWYEREYFRVDWSMNLVDTPVWQDMFLGRLTGEIKITPFAYYVNNKTDPDAVHFEAENGYFDVTSKFQVEPAQMDSPFIDLQGKIPACILQGIYTGAAVDTCDIQEAVIRSSYVRADKIPAFGDFEPFENTRSSLNIIGNPGGLGDSFSVGIVTPPRVSWDPQYGYTDANMVKHFHHHNIWQQSHQPLGANTSCSYKARRDDDANGTDDQCENARTGYAGNGGSQCSLLDRCTIPYRDRKIATFSYWVNAETPAELLDPPDAQGNYPVDEQGKYIGKLGHTEQLTTTWNQALSFTVAKAREVECLATGGDKVACRDQYFEPGQTEMIAFGGWAIPKIKPLEDVVLVTCHNPVRSYDHKVCGPAGSTARVGDIRKNFMYFWPYESRAPWGGIANWNADPITGQIIGASATTMGRSAYRSAAQVRDIIMVANGELTFEDITGGVPASLYQKKLREGDKPYAMTAEEIERRVASVDARNVARELSAQGFTAGAQSSSRFEQQVARLEKLQKTAFGGGGTDTSRLEFESVASRVRGSQIEAQMMGGNWLVDTLRVSPNMPMTSDVLDAASPLRGMDPNGMNVSAFRQSVDLGLQARGACFMETAAGDVGNLDVQGVAAWFANEFSDGKLREDPAHANKTTEEISRLRADKIYTYLWHETYKGIQLHEIGHSLGMLHQFASSFDAINFNPQYWQLRTKEGTAAASCNGTPRPGNNDTCMGPRYLDPETDEEMGRGSESRPGISYFGHTSTMEYQNERFFETVGLGSYDLMTMGVLYGRLIQTMDPEIIPPGTAGNQLAQGNFSAMNYTQLTEQNLLLSANEGAIDYRHYTQLARDMKIFDADRDCRAATDDEKKVAAWRIVNGKVCTHTPREYARWIDMEDGPLIQTFLPIFKRSVKTGLSYGQGGDAGVGNVRWPYRWGSTNNAYIHTNPGDAGADIYEAVVETIRKYQYNYPFRYFRRQNRDWLWTALPSRVDGEFYERLRAFHWSIASTNARSIADGTYDASIRDDNNWRPYILAETLMFEAIMNAFMTPQPGGYGASAYGTPDSPVYDVAADSGFGAAQFTLDAANSRFVDPDFNSDPDGGGSWEYQAWVNHAGFTAEKVNAIRSLVDGRAVFSTISRENYLDGRNVFINYRSDFPDAMDRLIGGVLSEDWGAVAPYVPNETRANPVVRSQALWEKTPNRPSNAFVLFPNVGYKQQLGTLVFSHIFARLNTDLGLSTKLRINLEGYSDAVAIPLAQQQRFTNPATGFTYYAKRYGNDTINGKPVDKGIGSRMLQRANYLASLVYQVTRDSGSKPVLGANGELQYVTDADGNALEVAEPTDTASPAYQTWIANRDMLRKYVGLIDAAVQLQQMVGYGPLNGFPGRGDFE